jgi:general secretion pathway protein G
MRFRSRSGKGYSLLEALLATVVLLILAGSVMPTAKYFVVRKKEMELRRSLREIRWALEAYHYCATVQPPLIQTEGQPPFWPEDLEMLVEGVPGSGAWAAPGAKIRFLRRIPKDPFNKEEEDFDGSGWKFRSPHDRMGSDSWGRDKVFEVYSGSEARAMNGSYYKDW